MSSLLLIDGDRNFREALAIALRLDGAEVASAGDAASARALLRGTPFDLCVVDLHLEGAEVLLDELTLRATPVLVTGPHADLLEHAAQRHPAAQVLEKPFRAGALLAHLAA